MNETFVQGHKITRKAVAAFLRGKDPVPPLRNASFYVVRDDGTPVGAKEVVYALTDGVGHWGNEAAQALLRLGFIVRVRRRAKTHSKPPYDAFVRSGHLVFDDSIIDEPGTDPGTFDPKKLADTRIVVLSARYERAGQADFRAKLLRAYGGRCAISGCDVTVALEAAHIAPYKGRETDRIDNGILLRSDLHLLFDAGLLGIDPDSLRVVLADELKSGEYAGLAGLPVRVPEEAGHRPNRAALVFRRDEIGPAPRDATRTGKSSTRRLRN